MRSLTCCLIAFVAISNALGAQNARAPRWQEIGTTSTGNKVFIDPRSISRDSAGIITATVRTVYKDSVATPQGPVRSVRSVAMFDCTRRHVAVKETIMFHDEARGTVYRRTAPARPGFGPVFTSNFSGVALDHVCKPPSAPPAR